MNNYSFPNYNVHFSNEVPSYNTNDSQTNFNYDFYNAPSLSFQNLDPRLNYVGQPPQNFPYVEEVNQQFYSDVQPEYDLSLPEKVEIEQKTDDELYVETWLSKIGKISINLNSTIEVIPSEKKTSNVNKRPVRISAVKLSLKKCLHVVKKLEDVQEHLKTNFSTMSSTDWKNKILEIGDLKVELSTLMSQFEKGDDLTRFKNAIDKRKRKRLNQHKRKMEVQRRLAIKRENCKRLHKDLDQWLENMKDAVERVKMEENMQKDADCVLAEVTKKKSDARKQLSLISALIKLRSVRENMAVQRGEKVPLEDRSAFSKITEKLTNMWEDISKVYTKEEQGLRIMLEKNATEDSKALRVSKDEKIIQQWQYILFGPRCVTSSAYWGLTSAEKDLETFIAIRRSWDTFLAAGVDQHGSKIPIGWALPSASSNSDWTKYLSEL